MGTAKGSFEKDAALLRDIHQLAGLLQNEEIVKKVPNLPWTASSRNWVQATIKSLENELLQRSFSTGTLRKLPEETDEDVSLLEVSIMERKSELEAVERKTMELQVEDDIMNKRFETFALHAIPLNIEQLLETFASLHGRLNEERRDSENNVAPDGTVVKVEQGMYKQHPKQDDENTFLWSHPEHLSNFNSIQSQELSFLAKYCRCILEQGFVTDSALKTNQGSTPTDCSNSRENLGAEMSSSRLNGSADSVIDTDIPISIPEEVSSQYYSQLNELNDIYAELQRRKVKQLVADGALYAALKQMKKDCQSFSIPVEGMTADIEGSCEPQNQSNCREVADLPSTIQLRNEILKTRDKIAVLKQNIEAQIEELRTKTQAASSSRTFSFNRTNTELKRHKLMNLYEQQEKVIGVLKNMKERGVKVADLLMKEKNMLEQAQNHAKHAAVEFQQIDHSFRYLEAAFDELQLKKPKRKPLTIHPDDSLSRLVHDILLQDATRSNPIAEQSPRTGYPDIKRDIEFDPENGAGDAFQDSKQWFKNQFSNEGFTGSAKSNSTIACDQITKLVRQLNEEIAQTTKQLDVALRTHRSELIKRFEAVENSEGSADNLKTQTSQNAEERLQMRKELKKLEIGLGSHMEQYDRHRRHIASDPEARKESEAFVDFFAHPNRAALNIKRWKSHFK